MYICITCCNHATILGLLILTIQYNTIQYNMTLFGVLHDVSCTNLN